MSVFDVIEVSHDWQMLPYIKYIVDENLKVFGKDLKILICWLPDTTHEPNTREFWDTSAPAPVMLYVDDRLHGFGYPMALGIFDKPMTAMIHIREYMWEKQKDMGSTKEIFYDRFRKSDQGPNNDPNT